MIYLDHNATTPLLPEVFEAMRPWFVERFANPSSAHPDGAAARQAIEHARVHVATLIGAEPATIVFTAGGTESDNLAIRGPRPSHLAIGAIEHPAVTGPARWLQHNGARLDVLEVDASGVVSGRPVPGTQLTSVMWANNETGVIQPIAELARAAHAIGSLFHTDAAQAVGKTPVSVEHVDLLTIAGHKLYGPKGVGALYVRPGVELAPVLLGAGHEGGLRPGTENVPAIVGLGEACRIASATLSQELERQTALRERLWAGVRALGARRTGSGPWLPNTLHVRFDRPGPEILAACPAIAASTGSACHAGSIEPSAVLLAMGLEPTDAIGAIRFSLGRHTTAAMIDRALALLASALASSNR